ncbi:MAG: 2-amino-4-hydroxy-6-hydroxymethyldihydropteridine diphosphokinase [Bacteroidota bacterium]
MAVTQDIYLSIGSNLGNRYYNLQKAVFELQKKVGHVTKTSTIYENPAVGFEGDDFLNCCVALKSVLDPHELMATVLDIEGAFGRKRTPDLGYQSRALDIDIVYYGDQIINNDDLTVPHPKMASRNFVLKPLADIAPQRYHPVLQKDTRNLLQECKDESRLDKTGLKLFANRIALFSQLQFLAIEGNIGAGKTTLAKKMAGDFNAKLVLERFADNPFLPKFYEDQARFAFPLEMSFLADRYQQFTDDTSQFDLFKNFMVSDYDIFKSLIFAKITLQKEEFELYRKVFGFMYKEVKKPDIYIYLYQRTDRLLANIKKRGRAYEQSIEPDYLEKINRGYLDFIKSHPNQKTLLLDLEELDFVEHESDYESVLTIIESEVISLMV